MIKPLLVTLAVIGIPLAAGANTPGSETGKELFMKKCAICHKTTRPSDMSTLVAPPIPGVAMHVKQRYPLRKDAMAFIESYAMHPQRSKALCMPQRIQRFGLMPSQKGKVTPQQLKKIAAYIVDNYPDARFVRMEKRREAMMAQAMKSRQDSPFLIARGLPHYSKLLMKWWNDPQLGLTVPQKTKLLAIRQETMSGVKKYRAKIMKTEEEIRHAIFAGERPEKLTGLLDRLADMKKRMTMIHLRCIHDTRLVLTPEQLKILRQKREMMMSHRPFMRKP
jgi:hypothetical protein